MTFKLCEINYVRLQRQYDLTKTLLTVPSFLAHLTRLTVSY